MLLFNRIRSLEEELEPKSENEDRGIAMTSDLQEKLSGDLKVIQTDLTACIDCWEEAMSRTVKSPAAAGRSKGKYLDQHVVCKIIFTARGVAKVMFSVVFVCLFTEQGPVQGWAPMYGPHPLSKTQSLPHPLDIFKLAQPGPH